MSWNYRVIYHVNEDEGWEWFGIHTCYYKRKKDKIPHSWSSETVSLDRDSLDDLVMEIGRFQAACEKPILYIKKDKLKLWKGKK
jgi:hypothetical protein